MSILEGKNFLEAIGWDEESRKKGFWDNFIDNVDAGAAVKVVLQIILKKLESGKKLDFKNTRGFFSKIKGFFTSGNVFKIVAGIGMVLFTPLVMPFLIAADLTREIIADAKGVGAGKVAKAIGSLIVEVVKGIGSLIVEVVKGIGRLIVKVAEGIGFLIIGSLIIGSLIESLIIGSLIVGSLIVRVAKGIGSAIGKVAGKIGSKVKEIVEKVQEAKGRRNKVKAVAEGIGSSIAKVAENIGSSIAKVAGKIGSKVKEIVEKVQKAKGRRNKVKDIVEVEKVQKAKGRRNKVKAVAEGIGSSIATEIERKVDLLLIITVVITGIGRKVKGSAIGKVAGKIGSKVKDVVRTVKDTKIVSKVVKDVVKKILEQAQGVTTVATNAKEAEESTSKENEIAVVKVAKGIIGSPIVKVAKEIESKVKEVAKEIGTSIVKVAKEIESKVKEVAKEIGTSILKVIKGAKEIESKVKEVAKEIESAIGSAIVKVAKGIGNKVKVAKEIVSSIVKGVISKVKEAAKEAEESTFKENEIAVTDELDKDLQEVLSSNTKDKYMTSEDKEMVDGLKKDIDDLDKSILKNEDDIELYNKKIQENNQEIETSTTKLNKITMDIDDIDNEIDKLTKILRDNEDSLKSMQESNEQTKLKIQDAENDINKDKQMKSIDKDILDLTENEEIYKKQLKTMEESLNSNNENIKKLKDEEQYAKRIASCQKIIDILLVNKVIQRIKYNNVFKKGAKERLTLDFSNSIFREAKRHLNEKKITETEYKDLIAMEIEQTLFDKYINDENNDLLEIVVSSQKQKENELAIRQGIKAFNERANSLIGEHAKNLPNIVIRDTKGNIVDVYSNIDINLGENIDGDNEIKSGKLVSRNEEIEESLSKDNFGMDNSLQQTLFSKMNLDLGAINSIKRIDITDTSKINRLKKQKEEIHQKISSINKEPLIINLDNVRDKDIDEFTSYVFREVVESGKITTNIVFTKNGRFFGATEKKVADKVEAWNDFENNLGIEKITRKNIYKNININSSLIGSNLETNYMTESINTSEDIGDNTNYEKDKMLYFDSIFVDENGDRKEAYKVDVIGEKVKITLNKECMYIWNKEENRQNFMYRLRQIEKQYSDLKKEIEIELPEIKKGDESKNLLEERKRKEKETKAINGRETIKKTCETFVLEYKNEKARRIYLQNDKGNILRVNSENLFGTFINFEEIKEKEVIIVPEYVLTDKLIFKNWLAQKLQSNDIRQKTDIILGLDNSYILSGKIQTIIYRYFENENIKIINRRGENIKIKEQETSLYHISDKDGEITINNPKINQRIIDKIKSMYNIETVQISDDFAKDTESVNMLISILNAKGYNGDINIIGYNGDIVKLWQTKIFEKGAISRELDNKKEFDEFLEAVSKNDILSKYPLVLNINSREKLKLKNLNKLINEKKLGNVTVLVRAEIVATNDEDILREEEKFEKLRDKSIKKLDKSKIEDIKVKNIDKVLEVRSEEEFKKDLCIVTKNLKSEKEDTDKKDDKKDDKNKENLELEKINILPVKNIPIYRGNILFNMKGAKDYIKDLDNLYKKENLTDEDIINISTQSSKAIRYYGLDFALESRKKMNKEASSNKSITKFLDIAA